MIGTKLLWTGFVFMFALITFLNAFGAPGGQILVVVGAIIAVIGLFLLWLDK